MRLKPNVLILTDWFSPGYKAGGPIQSVRNLIEHLGNDVDFTIITGDCDLNDEKQYAVDCFDKWIDIDNCRVCYTTKLNRSRVIRRELKNTQYTCIYLNSLFSKDFSLYPLFYGRKLGVLDKIILAPRGMLGWGALRLKPKKKKLFLALFKFLKIHKSIAFHSTDSTESMDIKTILGSEIKLSEIFNLPANLKPRSPICHSKPIKFVFASRVSPKKNLDFAIKTLSALNQPICLDIFGAIEENSYWETCKSLASDKIRLTYHGSLKHRDLIDQISNAHFFILPTLNENFGHAIVESMSIGLPVIISDQTPWSDIENIGAGRVVPLIDSEKWLDVLKECVSMSDEEYQVMCQNSIRFVQHRININEICMIYRKLFHA